MNIDCHCRIHTLHTHDYFLNSNDSKGVDWFVCPLAFPEVFANVEENKGAWGPATHSFHPKRFILRERYKFWSHMDRKPGEKIQELVAPTRHDAITFDFPAIQDPLDETVN